MLFTKKNRYKPLLKKFLNIRENIQNRDKILNFKKQKWILFINASKKKLKWFNKCKLHNQNWYLVFKFPIRYASYIKKYKRTMQSIQTFSLMYGGLTKPFIKKNVNLINQKKFKTLEIKTLEFLKLFEHWLDVTLFRAKFCHSVRHAQQLILHGKVLINSKIVLSKNYLLSKGDIISINIKDWAIIKQLIYERYKRYKYRLWPIPPKHLIINYDLLKIKFFYSLTWSDLPILIPFYLNLERILVNFSKLN